MTQQQSIMSAKVDMGTYVLSLISKMGLDHDYEPRGLYNGLMVPGRYKEVLESAGVDFKLASSSFGCDVEGHNWYGEIAYAFLAYPSDDELKAISKYRIPGKVGTHIDFIKRFNLPHAFVKTDTGYKCYLPQKISLAEFYRVEGMIGDIPMERLLVKYGVLPKNHITSLPVSLDLKYAGSEFADCKVYAMGFFAIERKHVADLYTLDFTNDLEGYSKFYGVGFKGVKSGDPIVNAAYGQLAEKDGIVGYWVPFARKHDMVSCGVFREEQCTSLKFDVDIQGGKQTESVFVVL